MFTPHDKNAVPTQKHLGSNGTSMWPKVVSRTLKTVQWLVLWVGRNKDDVNKSTLFRKRMFKLETTHFHGRVRRSNVHRGISARRSNVKTLLYDGKCHVATIRQMTIPKLELQAAVYGVHLRKQRISEHDVRIDKIYHWSDSSTLLQWLQAAHKIQQMFVVNRAAEILENSLMDQWRLVKGVENPADNGTPGISNEGPKEWVWLNRPAWLQTDEEKWRCQVNEVEAEQVTSTVATESKLDQLFDWRRNRSCNRNRNFIA